MVFACRRCRQQLTTDVKLIEPPPDDRSPEAEPWFEPGVYFIDRERARLARTDHVQPWPPKDRPVLNPIDVTGVREHSEPARLNGCCGLDGMDGPNIVCIACGAEVGTKMNDCWTPHEVRLDPDAVTT